MLRYHSTCRPRLELLLDIMSFYTRNCYQFNDPFNVAFLEMGQYVSKTLIIGTKNHTEKWSI